jgi:hypothetical protein
MDEGLGKLQPGACLLILLKGDALVGFLTDNESPGRFKTRMTRASIGLEITCSNSGTTVPVEVMLV